MANYFVHPSSEVGSEAAIGKNTKIWHFCHVMNGAVLGASCVLGQNVFVANDVTIGNSVKIQNNVSIYKGVKILDGAFIGPSAVFTNVINPRGTIERKNEYRATIVGKGCTIGANATIICGNNLGDYSLIGAGAVVTKNVPDFALIIGNPGHQIGWVSKAGHRLEFDENGIGICPENLDKYLFEAGKVISLDEKSIR